MKASASSGVYSQSQSQSQSQEMEEQVGGAMGMEVDDSDSLDILSDFDRQPLDADFFNSFEDDFDDADIN